VAVIETIRRDGAGRTALTDDDGIAADCEGDDAPVTGRGAPPLVQRAVERDHVAGSGTGDDGVR
jgi:hypothetical protein